MIKFLTELKQNLRKRGVWLDRSEALTLEKILDKTFRDWYPSLNETERDFIKSFQKRAREFKS